MTLQISTYTPFVHFLFFTLLSTTSAKMMCGQLFSILILLIIPLFSNAAQCPVGHFCKHRGSYDGFMERKESKECDACVVFSCPTGVKTKAFGYGCFDDFINVCKWTPADIKEALYHKSMNGTTLYGKKSLELQFASSKHSNSDALEKYKKKYEPKFGRQVVNGTLGSRKTCPYNDTPKPMLAEVNCPVRAQCIPSKEFPSHAKNFTSPDNRYPSSHNNTCSACVSFLYTDDYQRIITGSGCYDDFEQLTKSTTVIPDEDKEFLKENQNDTYLIGENYVLYSCNSEDDCAAGKSLLNYNLVNKKDLSKLTGKFNTTFDEECRPPIDITGETTTQPSKGIRTATGLVLTGIVSLIFLF